MPTCGQRRIADGIEGGLHDLQILLVARDEHPHVVGHLQVRHPAQAQHRSAGSGGACHPAGIAHGVVVAALAAGKGRHRLLHAQLRITVPEGVIDGSPAVSICPTMVSWICIAVTTSIADTPTQFPGYRQIYSFMNHREVSGRNWTATRLGCGYDALKCETCLHNGEHQKSRGGSCGKVQRAPCRDRGR